MSAPAAKFTTLSVLSVSTQSSRTYKTKNTRRKEKAGQRDGVRECRKAQHQQDECITTVYQAQLQAKLKRAQHKTASCQDARQPTTTNCQKL